MSGSRGSQVSSTPAKLQTREGIAPAETEKMDGRRRRLVRQLEDGWENEDFQSFLFNIGGLNAYNDFIELANISLSEDIARAVPSLHVRGLKATRGMESNSLTQTLLPVGKTGEAALMSYFFALCNAMAEEASRSTVPNIPKARYILIDHQTKSVDGTTHKADGVFYYSKRIEYNMSTVHMFVEAKLAPTPRNLPAETLGQLLDYVNAIWTEQATRIFVPILYLHGEKLTLLLFTRGSCYRVNLGNICYTDNRADLFKLRHIRETLLSLWFIITLPADRFGHFCDVDTRFPNMRFDRLDPNKKQAYVTLVGPENSDALALKKRIPRRVNLRSRLAYLFDTICRSKRAVLKLLWTPVKRLPEGAVYEVLHRSGISGIPEVYDTGLIREDFYGYRLEYIILEHCGDSIEAYIRDGRNRRDTESEIHMNVEQFISQVTSCLVQARIHGILHRDISDGNIAVNNGQAKVIDWGYAKIIEAGSAEARGTNLSFVDEVAQQWGFEKAPVLKKEAESDHMTGTVLFMSIPVLFGARKRSLADDIESLFYVIIRAFSTSDNCCGFRYYDNENLAFTRVGILGCTDNYLKHFSAESNVGGLRKTLDAMYRYLFYSGDRYIGHDLVNNENYERLPDLAMAAKFMDKKSVSALQKLFPTNNNEAGVGSKRKSREGT